MTVDYETVTEVPGRRASRQQLAMLYTRYAYAARFAAGKDVLEVGCGSGIGLGYLAQRARRAVGGDYTEGLLRLARRQYGDTVPLVRLDAHDLPFRTGSFDVVVLYEAIYYLTRPAIFVTECRRVLRTDGLLLICTVNPEWSDFNPSPFSIRYTTAHEISTLLRHHGFRVEVNGAFPAASGSLRDRAVSVIKRLAVRWHLIPRTMKGKEALKRLVFGRLVPLPTEIHDGLAPYCPPVPVGAHTAVRDVKVLFVTAHRED